MTIDFAGLAQRIVAVDLPSRDYTALQAGPNGTVFFIESVPANGVGADGTNTV